MHAYSLIDHSGAWTHTTGLYHCLQDPLVPFVLISNNISNKLWSLKISSRIKKCHAYLKRLDILQSIFASFPDGPEYNNFNVFNLILMFNVFPTYLFKKSFRSENVMFELIDPIIFKRYLLTNVVFSALRTFYLIRFQAFLCKFIACACRYVLNKPRKSPQLYFKVDGSMHENSIDLDNGGPCPLFPCSKTQIKNLQTKGFSFLSWKKKANSSKPVVALIYFHLILTLSRCIHWPNHYLPHSPVRL